MPFTLQDADYVLPLVRVSVALTLFVWVSWGPFPDFYPQQEGWLYAPSGLAAAIPPVGHVGFYLLKLTVLSGCLGMLVRPVARLSTVVTAGAFGWLNGYVSGFGDLWNYNTHLNIFLICLSLCPTAGARNGSNFTREAASALLFFMRFEVAIVYLQAGLAKLVHGGLLWPTRTPYVHLILQDRLGATWLSNMPEVVTLLGYLVIVSELALPILLLAKPTRWFGVTLAVLLHVSFYLGLGISFWHLWVLFPALFLIDRKQKSLRPENSSERTEATTKAFSPRVRL
ncbi:hypothetical protein [Bradyrhizobium japonicum]|uniref:hypothetical protein n=1 Tax=Bradyrhizobium japonicum TaxID=375 RepID=UPI00200E2F83|nr:hypothetical protein [Bradyrhizobium japonicum]UQE03527.1 HTTM domain-containing protein [Bradyrhizobium japonicum]